MKITENINKDLFAAMRDKKSDVVRTLRMAMASIKYAEKEKRKPLEELEVVNVLQKEIKVRQESIEEAKKGNRQDIIDENEHDINILEKYLPTPLSEAELEDMVKKIIAETGAETIKDMGKVMPAAVQQVQGRAANSMISQVVRKFLVG